MRGGLMKHPIVIQQLVEGQDDAGSPTKEWEKFCDARAQFIPVSGRESFKEYQEQAFLTARFRIRYRAGITPKMRIVFEDNAYDIIAAPDVLGKKRELDIMTQRAG